MIKRWMPILTLGCLGAAALAQNQVTPPVMPKTVETPKLIPLVAPPLPPGAQTIANAPLTVTEAVQITLAHQPQVAISKAAADALHGMTLQTQSQLGPTVTADLS